MTRGLGPLLALVAGAACAAPQQPGVVRTGYIAMATLDGAVVGGSLGVGACALVGGEHTPTRLAAVCGTVAGAVGGAISLAGSLRTDQEPDLARWVTIPVLPALIVVAGLVRLVE